MGILTSSFKDVGIIGNILDFFLVGEGSVPSLLVRSSLLPTSVRGFIGLVVSLVFSFFVRSPLTEDAIAIGELLSDNKKYKNTNENFK